MVIAGLGCKGKQAKPKAEPKVEAAAGDDAMFVFARGQIDRAPVPARFSAPLPTTVDELAAVPPDPFVDAALTAGTGGMRDRLAAAIEKAAAAGAIPEELHDYYVARLQAGQPAACDWIAGQVTGPATPAARAVYWAAIDRCTGPATEAAFDRSDAPDAAIIDWYFERSETRSRFRPRVVQAAATVARSSDDYEARKIGFAFAGMDGPEVVPAMIALQRSIPDPDRRALVAVGMLHHPSPAGRALGTAACKRPAIASDAMCRDDDGSDSAPADAPASVADAVSAWDFDVTAVLKQYGRGPVIEALHACATAHDEDADPGRCLSRLASIDRAGAVEIAQQLQPDPDDLTLTATVAALTTFPDDSGLAGELDRLGFAPVPGTPPPVGAAITAEELLDALGRVDAFDTETDQYPNEHDRLLARLATRCAPALDGVVFEEEPPALDDEHAPYRLRAYADGLRYQVTAQNLGDWYDVEAVIGLLNTLLRARGSDLRIATLPTGDQTTTVVIGPGPGLVALARRGLLDLGDPGEGEARGKEFEDRVFEQLQREGSDVQRDVPIAPPR